MQLYCWNISICNLTLRECLKRVLVVNFRKLTTHILRKKQGSFLSYRSQWKSFCLCTSVLFNNLCFFSLRQNPAIPVTRKKSKLLIVISIVLLLSSNSLSVQSIKLSNHSLQLAQSHSFQKFQMFFPAGKLWYFRESWFCLAHEELTQKLYIDNKKFIRKFVFLIIALEIWWWSKNPKKFDWFWYNSTFETTFRRNHKFEFFRWGLNWKIYTSRGELVSEIKYPEPWFRLLIVQKLRNVLVIKTHPRFKLFFRTYRLVFFNQIFNRKLKTSHEFSSGEQVNLSPGQISDSLNIPKIPYVFPLSRSSDSHFSLTTGLFLFTKVSIGNVTLV